MVLEFIKLGLGTSTYAGQRKKDGKNLYDANTQKSDVIVHRDSRST